MRPIIALATIVGCAVPDPGEPNVPPTEDEPTDTGLTPAEEAEALGEFVCAGGLPVFYVCPCDVEVDWSHLTEDMFGEPVQPERFELLGLARSTSSSVEEVLDDACDEDSLTSASTTGYADLEVLGLTSAYLSDLSFLGTPAAPLELGRTYWLFWSDDTQPGVGIRMAALASVVEDGANAIEMVWP